MNPNVVWIIETLTLGSPLILFFGIILGLKYYARLDDFHRLLLLYLFVALIIDLLGRIMAFYFNNNLILIPIFGLLELLLLSSIYFKYLIGIKNKLWAIPIAILVLFNLYEILNLINIEPKDFYCNSRVLDSLAIVIMSIIFYIKTIANEDPIKPGLLFLNTIIFAFHSLNLILYLPINFLINEQSNIKFHFWSISLFLTLIFYVSMIRIIWMHGKNHKL